MIDTSDYSLNSGNQEEQANIFKSDRKWLNFWRSLVYLMLISLGGGISYSWYFLSQKMIPWLEKPVSKFLSRPIKLGEIKAVTFTSVRLGESYFPTTATENDYAVAEEVVISINPFKLFEKKLELDINLKNAQGYLQQDQNNAWLQLKLNPRQKKEGGWRIRVDQIQVQNAQLSIKNNRYLSNPSLSALPAAKVSIPRGDITFNPNKYIFNVQGSLDKGGEIKSSGLYTPSEKTWRLQLNNKDVAIDTVTQLIRLPVNLNSGKVNGNLAVSFLRNKINLSSLDGEIDFAQVNLIVPRLPQTISKSTGKIIFKNNNITLADVDTNFGSIKAQAQGRINNFKTLDLQAQTNKSVTIDQLLSSLKIDQQVKLKNQGKVKGKVNIIGEIRKPLLKAEVVNDGAMNIERMPISNMSANVAIQNNQLNLDRLEVSPAIGGKLKAQGKVNLNRKESNFSINWQAEDIAAEKLASIYQQQLPLKVGTINGNYNLTGNWRQFEQTRLTGVATVDVAGGKAQINQLELKNNNWRGEVNLSAIKLAEVPQIDCSKIGCQNSLLDGQFSVSGTKNNFKLENIALLGKFNFDLARGKVRLQQTKLTGDNWQSLVQLNNVDVRQLPSVKSQTSTPQKAIALNANLKAQGNLSNMGKVDVSGRGNVNLPQGRVNFDDFDLSLNQENFVATAVTNKLALKNWHPSLRGDASGKFIAKGNLNSLQPENLDVQGNVRLNQGISVVTKPMDVDFAWKGNYLQVNQAVADNIKAKGIINYDLASNTVEDINLDVVAQQLDVKELPLPQSLNLLDYQGKIDFQGNVKGNLAQPQLAGKVALKNLKLANLLFSPLQGNVTASSTQGVNLDLDSSTNQDQLAIVLNSQYQPEKIYLQNKQTIVQGTKNKDNLAFNLENIPLKQVTQAWLDQLPPSVKEVDGNLSGNVNLNSQTFDIASANLTVNQPRLNHLQGDQLSTELTSHKGLITIHQGSLRHQNNRYDFTGELQPFSDNPRLNAQLDIKEGDIQNLLTSWHFFEFADISDGFQPRKFATAKDLYALEDNSKRETNVPTDEQSKQPLVSIKTPNEESLLDTLDFFETLETEITQNEADREKATIPTLEDLDGKFTGDIDLDYSVATGIQAEFDFQGDSWQWGRYEGDYLKLKGSYDNGLITILPVEIKSRDTALSVTGTFKPERISGEVTLSNFPLAQLRSFLNIPKTVKISGDINAAIAISGSEEKPLAKGNIEVVDSSINGNTIKKTEASFGYRNSRIDFLASSNLTENIESMQVIASIPFQLFPNSIKPENDNFLVNFNLNKKGFEFLNVLTNNQLSWVAGNGEIDLDIKGQYNQATNEVSNLQTEGVANLENGIINGKLLAGEAITDINGQVLFNFAQLNIPNLSGNFSGGQIALTGTLPLINDDASEQTLNILVDDIALDLDELYQGNAQANLAIAGSAIAPEIGGQIKLDQGEIRLPKQEDNSSSSLPLPQNNLLGNVKFNNFALTLGDDIHIVQPFLLKLRAQGDLNFNGKLNNLKPEGVVHLKSGTVNLFTNQLKVAENRDNTAKFTPENGFNPFLDLQLVTSVTETGRYQFVDNLNSNEIRDLSTFSVNTAQTVRIRADINGWSDNLVNNIELSSSPSRNKTEIVALLGGGFVNNSGEGDSNLNLVNFASAAVIGSVQGEIHKAIGFDELRLFPAQIIDPEERTSTFGLGAELALDLTDDFSVSVTKILTNEQAPRYSIRYRLNEQTILRGSSDFEKDSRGVIEFEKRF